MGEVVCGRRVVSEREKILREIKGSIRRARKLRIGVGLEIVREPLRRFRIPGSIDTTRRGLCVRPLLLLWRSLLARVLWVLSMQCVGTLLRWRLRSRNPLSEPSLVG